MGTLREPVCSKSKKRKECFDRTSTRKGAAVIRNCGDPLIRDALADVFIMPPDLEGIAENAC